MKREKEERDRDSHWRSACSDGYFSYVAFGHEFWGAVKARRLQWSALSVRRQRRIVATFSFSAHWCRWHGGRWAQGTLSHPRTRSFAIQSAGVYSAGRRSGGRFLPPCGRCGYTTTRSSSEVAPPLTRRLFTTRGGLLYLGIKEASAPCSMYPCHRMLCNTVI